MITVFLRVISIFALVGIGYVLNKKGIFAKEAIGYFTSLLLWATVPALNFSSIVLETFDTAKLKSILEIIIGTFVYYFVALFVSYFIAKRFKNISKPDAGILMAAMTSINCAFMGFPVTKSIFGDEYLFYMVLINALSSFYAFLLIHVHFGYGDTDKGSLNVKKVLKSIMNFPFIATVCGFVIFFLNIKLPVVATDFCQMLGAATTPVSMIVIGIQLGEINIKSLLSDKNLLITSFIKLILYPGIVLAAVWFLPVTNFVKIALPLAICFPTATITTSVAHQYGRNETLMAKGVAITTLFSVVSVSVWCIILTTLFL